MLNAIQLFGANLDDYLHLLLPPIVKLFDATDVPLQARKSVPRMAHFDERFNAKFETVLK